MDIRDKVVLITGASAGIGLATTRLFAREGAKLALAARSYDALVSLADELDAETLAIETDMTDPEQVKQTISHTIEQFGQIDILINNAGQAASGSVANLNPNHFRQIIDLNVFGPLVAMQAVIPFMKEQGGGLIMNVSSMVSKMKIPALSAYAATKVALNMISDTARVELLPDNIRVITVYPRLTATDFGKNSLGDQSEQQTQRASNASIPIDTPEHVAEKILFAAINEPEEQFMDR